MYMHIWECMKTRQCVLYNTIDVCVYAEHKGYKTIDTQVAPNYYLYDLWLARSSALSVSAHARSKAIRVYCRPPHECVCRLFLPTAATYSSIAV